MPDHPRVTVEISGLRGTGKSILAALFRDLLEERGMAFSGPADLPARGSDALKAAVRNLKIRGLSIIFVETQTGIPPQIDARLRRP